MTRQLQHLSNQEETLAKVIRGGTETRHLYFWKKSLPCGPWASLTAEEEQINSFVKGVPWPATEQGNSEAPLSPDE